MASRHVCPICNSLLKEDLLQYEPPPWQWDTRPWYTEVRGIYAIDDDMAIITVTGVGVIRNRNTLYAPVDRDRNYFDVPIDSLKQWTIRGSSGSQMCFAFHESCWTLLLLRIRQGNTVLDDASIMQSVFYQLCHIPGPDSSGQEYVRTYGDAENFRETDPCALPSLDHIENLRGGLYDGLRCGGQKCVHPRVMELTNDYERPSPYGDRSLANSRGGRHDILSRLPLEILYEVLTYLSFDRIGTVRRTCRYLARLASITMLPQLYWRSRFMLGQELDHIFPCLTDTRDWFRLYSGIRVYERRCRQPLWNRWIIRDLLEPMASLIDLYPITQNGPQGLSSLPVRSRGNAPILVNIMSSEGGPCLTKVIGYLSARLTSVEEYRPLKSECHSLYRRAQPFVAPENLCQLRCVISTVRLGSCQLISGIKVCPSDGESGTSQWIGYRSPGNETWFDIPKDKRIRAFDISLSPEGLRGIQILYTGSGESRWVGDKHGRGIARGTLFLPSGEGRYYLLAELDRFKIITLGFGEMTGRQKRASHPSPSSTIATRCSQIKSCLWEPCIPTHRGLIISPLLPLKAPPTFNPLLNFDFGGWRGRQLSVLTRLDFHLTHDRHPLIGLVAYYANKGSITCGSTGGHAMSIFLDSSNGERVTQVRILRDQRYHTRAARMVGIQVSTSFGQTVTFAPLFHHLNASVRTISGVPPDHTITGLVAHPMSYKGHFDQIRIQSQMCDVAPTNSDVPNRDRHRVPTDQIRYDLMLHQRNDTDYMRFYPTYASLKGVRTIAASTAEGPYSPMARYITGLKFEYYDHPSPSVVGQWIYPLSKEKTELSPDEEVESITVWINSSSKSRFPGMRTGQISAIYITTTAQRLEFYAGSLALTLAIQGQYKRDTDEELTAISWVLGADSDRVRAVISPKGKQKTHILNPPLSAPYEGVNKLYFARPYGGTWKKKLRWVEVYYDGVEIVGLRFIYKSNDRATIGNKFSGTLDRIFHFPEYDKITGFSVKAAGSALMQLELEIKRGRSYRYLSLGQESHPRYTYDRHCYWGENPAHFQTSTNPYRQPLMEKVYKPPKNSRLTGIYVDYHWISLIGAIYEPVRTETNSS